MFYLVESKASNPKKPHRKKPAQNTQNPNKTPNSEKLKVPIKPSQNTQLPGVPYVNYKLKETSIDMTLPNKYYSFRRNNKKASLITALRAADTIIYYLLNLHRKVK